MHNDTHTHNMHAPCHRHPRTTWRQRDIEGMFYDRFFSEPPDNYAYVYANAYYASASACACAYASASASACACVYANMY